MEKIIYESYADTCKEEIRKALIKGLYEAGGEVLAQVKRNTRVDTGQLKGSWQLKVSEEELEAYIGSPLENAIWEEYGTGEYAINGDGRKGFRGKPPSRALAKAFIQKKPVVKKLIEKNLKEVK